MNRKYELKERALRQKETRQRIVEAAVGLHTSVGPARTTISGIAERAGVERHTVYAHFPDDRTLFRACSEHWGARHPLPDFETLERDRGSRFAVFATLSASSTRGTSPSKPTWRCSFEMLLVVPANADVLDEMTAGFATLVDAVSQGWPRRKSVRAAIGHALEFETWRSLVRRQGLSRTQAVDAMARFASSL